MKLVISNPKTKNAFTIESEEKIFLGKKINQTIELTDLGLEGYSAKISGGSDKDGFPMRQDIQGTARKKVFLTQGVGFKGKKTKKIKGKKKKIKIKGLKKRISVRGNTISEDIAQVNLIIVKEGKKNWDELIPKKKEESEKTKPIETNKENIRKEALKDTKKSEEEGKNQKKE